MKERIQKVLANAGVASRRNVEEMILQGRVAVNGRVHDRTAHPHRSGEGQGHSRRRAGEALQAASEARSGAVYIVMNKPKGVYSTNVAQGEQTRAIDLLPPDFPARVYPVGRLDAESKGLLLLTNDGELTNQLTHPRYGVSKTYRAIVDGYVPNGASKSLQKGVWLADPKCGKGFKTGRTHDADREAGRATRASGDHDPRRTQSAGPADAREPRAQGARSHAHQDGTADSEGAGPASFGRSRHASCGSCGRWPNRGQSGTTIKVRDAANARMPRETTRRTSRG